MFVSRAGVSSAADYITGHVPNKPAVIAGPSRNCHRRWARRNGHSGEGPIGSAFSAAASYDSRPLGEVARKRSFFRLWKSCPSYVRLPKLRPVLPVDPRVMLVEGGKIGRLYYLDETQPPVV